MVRGKVKRAAGRGSRAAAAQPFGAALAGPDGDGRPALVPYCCAQPGRRACPQVHGWWMRRVCWAGTKLAGRCWHGQKKNVAGGHLPKKKRPRSEPGPLRSADALQSSDGSRFVGDVSDAEKKMTDRKLTGSVAVPRGLYPLDLLSRVGDRLLGLR
jgi:hypothetical protein